MNYAWHGTPEDAIMKWPARSGGAGSVHEASPAGVQGRPSLPLTLDAIASCSEVPRDLHVILEYRLPFNGQSGRRD